jgi:hypothetical protein
MRSVITVAAIARAGRLIMCGSVLLASLGLCSACAPPEPSTSVPHECCPHKHDRKPPNRPAENRCQNSRLDSSLAERPEAGSVVNAAQQYELSPASTLDFSPPSSSDEPVVFVSSLVRTCQSPANSVLLI